MAELDPRLRIDPATVSLYADPFGRYIAGRRMRGEGIYVQLGRNPNDEPLSVSLSDNGSEPVYVAGPYFRVIGSPGSQEVAVVEGSQAGWGRHLRQDAIKRII